MTELPQLKKCIQCGELSESQVNLCPNCENSSFEAVTVEELKTMGRNGKIRAYFLRLPILPYPDAWKSVVTRGDLGKPSQ